MSVKSVVCGVVVLIAAVSAAEARGLSERHASYTCEELVKHQIEDAGRVIYYVAGHYDSKKDVWTDYAPNHKTETADVYEMYLPVDKIYAHCTKNPNDTVSGAIALYRR